MTSMMMNGMPTAKNEKDRLAGDGCLKKEQGRTRWWLKKNNSQARVRYCFNSCGTLHRSSNTKKAIILLQERRKEKRRMSSKQLWTIYV